MERGILQSAAKLGTVCNPQNTKNSDDRPTAAKAVKPEDASQSASMKSRVAPKVLCLNLGEDGGDMTSGSGRICARLSTDLCLSTPLKLQCTKLVCCLASLVTVTHMHADCAALCYSCLPVGITAENACDKTC